MKTRTLLDILGGVRQEADPSRPWSDFHVLALRVLYRACWDILRPTKGRQGERMKGEAWKWIREGLGNPSPGKVLGPEWDWPLSAGRICEILDLDREYLIEILRKGRPS